MTTLLNIKIEDKLKKQAQAVAAELGFPLSTLLKAYIRQLINNKTVYFSIKPTYQMTPELEEELNQIEDDIKTGRNLSPGFSTAKDALAYLKSVE